MSVFTSKNARVDAMRAIPIFANLPKRDVVALDALITATTVDAGFELAREDRAPQQLFLIVSGTATVRRNKRKIATLGPGDSVGELSVLDGGKQTATVTADGPCDVLVVRASDFRAMLDDSPSFARNLLKSLAVRLREADRLIAG